MPAGPRMLYYGVGLSLSRSKEILDWESFIAIEDVNRYIDYSYSDAIEDLLKKEGFEGEIIAYCNSPPHINETTNYDQTMWVYGFKVVEFDIFKRCKFSADTSPYQEDINKFTAQFHISKTPKYYCVYAGD